MGLLDFQNVRCACALGGLIMHTINAQGARKIRDWLEAYVNQAHAHVKDSKNVDAWALDAEMQIVEGKRPILELPPWATVTNDWAYLPLAQADFDNVDWQYGYVRVHLRSKRAAIAASVDNSCTAGARYKSGRIKSWIALVEKKDAYETAQEAARRVARGSVWECA